MARWTNPLTRRRCSSKLRYGDIASAELKAEAASRKTGDLIIAYECPDCGRFHIGHADLSQQLARQPGSRSCLVCSNVISEERIERVWEAGSVAECCSGCCQRQIDRERNAELAAELSTSKPIA